MKFICEEGCCSGCMACAAVCPHDAIHLDTSRSGCQAVIDPQRCVGCLACKQVCPQLNPPSRHAPIACFEGWANNNASRNHGSSGGLAAALAEAMLGRGGTVYSCAFSKGEFSFFMAKTMEEVRRFSGSKYVKSDASGVYMSILHRLRAGQAVLFIGLPCQVAALRKLSGKHGANLITAELICHGTPSPSLLDQYLHEHGHALCNANDISFRRKGMFQLLVDGQRTTRCNVRDPYTIAFLESLSYTDNCYSCPYAQHERVADLTLGDCWGSRLPMDEWKRGVSLLLCQTEAGLSLAKEASARLEPIAYDQAAAHNAQLRMPSPVPKRRSRYFALLEKGISFSTAARLCAPKAAIRQDIKAMLLKAGLFKTKA